MHSRFFSSGSEAAAAGTPSKLIVAGWRGWYHGITRPPSMRTFALNTHIIIMISESGHRVSSFGAHRTTVHQQRASLDGESRLRLRFNGPTHRIVLLTRALSRYCRDERIPPHEVEVPQLQNERIADSMQEHCTLSTVRVSHPLATQTQSRQEHQTWSWEQLKTFFAGTGIAKMKNMLSRITPKEQHASIILLHPHQNWTTTVTDERCCSD